MTPSRSARPLRLFRGRLTTTAADKVEEVISDAIDHIASTPFTGPRAAAIAAELVAACRLLRHGLWRLRDEYGDGPPDTGRLTQDFREAPLSLS